MSHTGTPKPALSKLGTAAVAAAVAVMAITGTALVTCGATTIAPGLAATLAGVATLHLAAYTGLHLWQMLHRDRLVRTINERLHALEILATYDHAQRTNTQIAAVAELRRRPS